MSVRKRSLKRSLAILPGVFAICLTAASAGSSMPSECPGSAGPSRLDYLVLASIADSSHFLALAAYRPSNY